MTPIPQTEPDYAEAQHLVQRWLGRCLLSLQQSERLLKTMLHNVDVKASFPTVSNTTASVPEVSRAYEQERLASMTLGGLVSAFCVDFARETRPDAADDTEDNTPTDQMTFQMRLGIDIEPSVMQAMREMVALRNEWVHHLIERFDLWSASGCAQALTHLQAGFDKAERFRTHLVSIGKTMGEVHQHVATFLISPEGQDMLRSGKLPLSNGAVVNALRQVMEKCTPAEDGSVSLQDMVAGMQARFPRETPERYGRVSWPQLIHESKIFRVIRHAPDGARIPPRVGLKSQPRETQT